MAQWRVVCLPMMCVLVEPQWDVIESKGLHGPVWLNDKERIPASGPRGLRLDEIVWCGDLFTTPQLTESGASRPCATTHLRACQNFLGVLLRDQNYSKRGPSLGHVAFRTKAFEYLDWFFALMM